MSTTALMRLSGTWHRIYFAQLLIGIFDASRDVTAENNRARSVSPNRVLADRCDRSTLRHGRGRSAGAIGSGRLARVNRHKGRFVSRELNGLWSQSPAIAGSIRICERGQPSRPVPCRAVTMPSGFRFLPVPHIRNTARWLGTSRRRGNPRERTVRSSAQTSPRRSGDFPRTCKRLYSALVIRSWSRKFSGLFVRPANSRPNHESRSKLQASDVISDHLLR